MYTDCLFFQSAALPLASPDALDPFRDLETKLCLRILVNKPDIVSHSGTSGSIKLVQLAAGSVPLAGLNKAEVIPSHL